MTTLAIAIGGSPAAASTTLDATMDGKTLPQTVITVASAASFPSTGSVLILTDEGYMEVFYTGKTGTTFTGCSGGVGRLSSSSVVKTPPSAASAQGGQQPSAPVINVGFDVTGGSDYATGGYTFDPAAVLQKYCKYDKAPAVITVLSEKKVTGGHWYEWWYDRANGKLVMLKDGADATTSDISSTPGSLRVLILAR